MYIHGCDERWIQISRFDKISGLEATCSLKTKKGKNVKTIGRVKFCWKVEFGLGIEMERLKDTKLQNYSCSKVKSKINISQ